MRTIGGVAVDAAFWATTPASVAQPLTPVSIDRYFYEAWKRDNVQPPPGEAWLVKDGKVAVRIVNLAVEEPTP